MRSATREFGCFSFAAWDPTNHDPTLWQRPWHSTYEAHPRRPSLRGLPEAQAFEWWRDLLPERHTTCVSLGDVAEGRSFVVRLCLWGTGLHCPLDRWPLWILCLWITRFWGLSSCLGSPCGPRGCPWICDCLAWVEPSLVCKHVLEPSNVRSRDNHHIWYRKPGYASYFDHWCLWKRSMQHAAIDRHMAWALWYEDLLSWSCRPALLAPWSPYPEWLRWCLPCGLGDKCGSLCLDPNLEWPCRNHTPLPWICADFLGTSLRYYELRWFAGGSSDSSSMGHHWRWTSCRGGPCSAPRTPSEHHLHMVNTGGHLALSWDSSLVGKDAWVTKTTWYLFHGKFGALKEDKETISLLRQFCADCGAPFFGLRVSTIMSKQGILALEWCFTWSIAASSPSCTPVRSPVICALPLGSLRVSVTWMIVFMFAPLWWTWLWLGCIMAAPWQKLEPASTFPRLTRLLSWLACRHRALPMKMLRITSVPSWMRWRADGAAGTWTLGAELLPPSCYLIGAAWASLRVHDFVSKIWLSTRAVLGHQTR